MIVLVFILLSAFAPDVLLPLVLALPWPAVADPTAQDRRWQALPHGVVQ